MPITNEEMFEAINSVLDQVANKVAKTLITDKARFGPYTTLPLEQALQRTVPVLKTIATCIATNNPAPLMALLDRIIETRLRTGYEPNVLLRAFDLFSDETVALAAATRPGDKNFETTLRRRMNYLNNSTKLHLANLNLTIPINERTEIDPDLLRQRELAS